MVRITTKNLFHEPIKLMLIISGLCFSLLIVHIGMGMINGSVGEATKLVDESDYDAFILQKNRPNILMGGRISDDIYDDIKDADCVEYVDKIIDEYVELKTGEEKASVAIIGYDIDSDCLEPWNVIQGNKNDLKKNNKIIVDRIIKKYFPDIKVGDILTGGYFDDELEVVGICKNAQRFGNAIIWTNLETAKKLLYIQNESTYLAVKTKKGYYVDDLKDLMKEYEDDVKTYSSEEMKDQLREFLLFDMGMASSIGILVIIGFMVSMIVVSITLYQSVSEKISEFVSLKALGASKSYINGILIAQTFIIVSISYAISIITAIILAPMISQVASLAVAVNTSMAVVTYFITLALGIFCSLFSIRKVHKTDPGIIFRA